MNTTAESIYENICRARNELEVLPPEYSLPKEDNAGENKVRFADGAMDGIALYHMGVPNQDTALLEQALNVAATDLEQAHELVRQWVKDGHMVSARDKILSYLLDHQKQLPPSEIYRLAAECALKGAHREEVKFGLVLLMLFDLSRNEPLKNAMRILALSDEFTLYVLHAATGWDKPNQEIFRIAKNVRGWGRIHAVRILEPETPEIGDWLFAEGWNNSVLPDYSAWECCQKSGLQKRLEDGMGEKDFSHACRLLSALLAEGPMPGISQAEDCLGLLNAFVDCAAGKAVSPHRQDTLKQIAEYAASHELPEVVQRVRFLL